MMLVVSFIGVIEIIVSFEVSCCSENVGKDPLEVSRETSKPGSISGVFNFGIFVCRKSNN